MRKAKLSLALFGTFLLLSSVFAPWSPVSAAEDSIKIRLDWVPRGEHSVFFVAMEKGYFKENNIAVETIVRGDGSANTAKLVGAGQFDFGWADGPTVAVAKVKGVPVTSLAVINQKSPMAFVALKETGLKHPKDIEGKTFGNFYAGSTYIFYKAFTKMLGIDRAKVKDVSVTVPYESFLLQKKVDAVVGYITAEVQELERKAGGPGSLTILQGSDYGYDVYGSIIFTNDTMIKNKPDLVKRFTHSYVKALNYTMAKPEDAVDQLLKHYKVSREMLIEQLQIAISKTFTSKDTEANGLGWQTAERWGKTQDTLYEQEVMDKKIDVKQLFTNDFLPKKK